MRCHLESMVKKTFGNSESAMTNVCVTPKGQICSKASRTRKKHREKKLRQIHQTTSFYSKVHHTSTTPQPTRCDSPLNSWHRPVGWIVTSTRSALENLCKPMKTIVPSWSENPAKSGQLKRSSSLAVESKLDEKNRNVDLVRLLCFLKVPIENCFNDWHGAMFVSGMANYQNGLFQRIL